jgi:hypothetical protein
MKKQILFLTSFVNIAISAQLYTPSNTVGVTTNPSSGNVGVGTSTPTELFHVNAGNLKVSNGNVLLDTSTIEVNGGNILMKGSQDVGDIIFINNTGQQYARIYTNPQGSRSLNFTTQLNNTPNLFISDLGNVGIGSVNPDSKLTVKGKIHAEEVKVDLAVPADYVFQKYYKGNSDLKPGYTMLSLEEVEAFTKENEHLPNIPSSKEIKENGLQVGEMTNLLLQKIEELTLYTIELKKRIDQLERKDR